MSDSQEPMSLPDDAETILRRTHWMWRAFLGMPFVYLLLGKFVESVWFESERDGGFWPLQPEGYRVLLVVLGVLAVGAQVALLVLRSRFNQRMHDAGPHSAVAAQLGWKRIFYLGACADAVSGLGLVAFLFNADWNALMAFCACSYLLYMQAFPGDGGVEPRS
jgi:hypothetical protein